MNRTDGSTQSAPRGVANDMGQVTHDFISLVELQIELGRIDTREAVGRLAVPATLLVVAAAVTLGTIPVALRFVAEAIVAVAGLSQWLALLIATVFGLGVAAIAAVVGWRRLRGPLRLFNRSRDEFKSNVQWIKRVLARRETSP